MKKNQVEKLKRDLKQLKRLENQISLAKTTKQKNKLETQSTSIAYEIINKYNLKEIDPSIQHDSMCERVVYDIEECIRKIKD